MGLTLIRRIGPQPRRREGQLSSDGRMGDPPGGDPPLGRKEATQLIPFQLWWAWRLKKKGMVITDLCNAVSQTRAVSTITSTLLPSVPLPEAEVPMIASRLQEIETAIGVLLSNGVILITDDPAQDQRASASA